MDARADQKANETIADIKTDLARHIPITEKTVQSIQNIIEADPNNREAHFVLANCYDQLGLPDLATEQYAEAVKLSPNDPHALVEYVKALIKNGDTKSAMQLLDAADKRFPKDPEVSFWYANSLATAGKFDDAVRRYKFALARNPNILGIHSAFGETLLDRGRYGDAVREADADLRIDKNFPLAHKVRGIALCGLGRFQEAIPDLQFAYKIWPMKTDLTHKYVAACVWNQDYRQALDPAIMLIAQTSSLDANNMREKQYLREIIRHLPEAVVKQRINELGPGIDSTYRNPAFHFALGDVLDAVGKPELAIDQYQAGIAMMPTFARGIFRLGKDLEQARHEYEQALFCYRKAHELAPSDKEINMHLVRLQQRLRDRQADIAWRLKDWLSGGIHDKGE